ncbi:MAG: Hsp20/alpha crystallin family protein [Deltaproteobacteria bacterium]|nr:Hsp20/alpha crystallin family protein [Deltaproteobacteria bacterium]
MSEKKKKEKSGFDLSLGKLSIGGIFKEFGNMMELVSKAAESGGTVVKTGGIRGLDKEVKGVYGFSIKTLAGKPVIEPFGNIKETLKGPVVEEAREPLMDVFDEKDYIRIIAEMPGVGKDDIKIDVKKDKVEIKAESGERKYVKRMDLPCHVDIDTLATSYKNGVMEIRLKKTARHTEIID